MSVDFGNLEQVKKAINKNTCGILVEPMQGEGGMKIPPKGFLAGLRELADEHDLLLVCDEIQVGMGRTGKKFCFEHDDIIPDGVILGKALSGGLVPLSVFITNAKIMDMVFSKGSDGSTFGGYPLACVAGTAALKVFEEIKLIKEEDACQLIEFTQSMSEKGIRYLFNSYIELHSPDIIHTISKDHELNNLQIYWFDLPTRYIDSFSDKNFNYATDELVRLNSYYRRISFEDIENCFHSNRWKELVLFFNAIGFTITISDSHTLINEVKEYDIILEIGHTKNDNSKYSDNSIERFNRGIIHSDDIEFIKEKNIPIKEISGYTDDNFTIF